MSRLTSLLENEVRLAVYRRFCAQGHAPSIAEVADALGVSAGNVCKAFLSLAEQHVLVLQPGADEVWMAMPFSAVETAFKVVADEGEWWANCAWDALGIPAMLGQDAEIYSTCPASGIPLRVTVTGKVLGVDTESVVHLLLPAARWWDDIGYTCSTIRLFRSEDDVQAWCTWEGKAVGEVLSLERAWRLAQAWYHDRLSPSWKRKPIAETQRLFGELGLVGSFWQLEGQ